LIVAVDPSAIGNLAQGFASLFLSGYDTRSYGDGRLGVDPVTATLTALSAASSAKSLFSGAGGKKAARQAMKGQQTAAFPPGTSFKKYLDMTMPHPNLGVKTHREIYQARKDSNWMLSRGIGSEKDYGAYVALYMIENGHCDPNVKNPNSPKYKNCPVFASNGINIFDVEALENYYKKDALKAEEQELAADVARLEAELAEVEKAEAQQKENLRAEESEIREKLAEYDKQLEELALSRENFQGIWQQYRTQERAEGKKVWEPCGIKPAPNGRGVVYSGPEKQSSDACRKARQRFDQWVDENKPLTMPEIIARQREILNEKRPFQQALTDIQKQLKTTSPELAARKNEILQELNPFKNALADVRRDLNKPVPVLGTTAANLPGAYSFGPEHDAIGAPEPQPAPEPAAPAWLLPALGAGALFLLTRSKR
jgi:hypothetical protein